MPPHAHSKPWYARRKRQARSIIFSFSALVLFLIAASSFLASVPLFILRDQTSSTGVRPRHVRTSDHASVVPLKMDLLLSQKRKHDPFYLCILRTNSRHHLAALFLRKDVGHLDTSVTRDEEIDNLGKIRYRCGPQQQGGGNGLSFNSIPKGIHDG